ncbi:MAG: hypothetical protein HYS32_01575 [Candidatus Woesearchaeota archaeon]|nr:MAG: hypothetical protein HYS32_01575 [Candidatus Woesearchaeota archaeon]
MIPGRRRCLGIALAAFLFPLDVLAQEPAPGFSIRRLVGQGSPDDKNRNSIHDGDELFFDYEINGKKERVHAFIVTEDKVGGRTAWQIETRNGAIKDRYLYQELALVATINLLVRDMRRDGYAKLILEKAEVYRKARLLMVAENAVQEAAEFLGERTADKIGFARMPGVASQTLDTILINAASLNDSTLIYNIRFALGDGFEDDIKARQGGNKRVELSEADIGKILRRELLERKVGNHLTQCERAAREVFDMVTAYGSLPIANYYGLEDCYTIWNGLRRALDGSAWLTFAYSLIGDGSAWDNTVKSIALEFGEGFTNLDLNLVNGVLAKNRGLERAFNSFRERRREVKEMLEPLRRQFTDERGSNLSLILNRIGRLPINEQEVVLRFFDGVGANKSGRIIPVTHEHVSGKWIDSVFYDNPNNKFSGFKLVGSEGGERIDNETGVYFVKGVVQGQEGYYLAILFGDPRVESPRVILVDDIKEGKLRDMGGKPKVTEGLKSDIRSFFERLRR